MIIRDAAEADLPALRDIFNDAVLNTTAIWMDNVVDLANRQAWFAARAQQGYPILVAENADGEVVGYASFGDWRPFDGFCHTVEHSVYIRADQRGKGIGKQLITHAKTFGSPLTVDVNEQNPQALAFYKRQGFRIVGRSFCASSSPVYLK